MLRQKENKGYLEIRSNLLIGKNIMIIRKIISLCLDHLFPGGSISSVPSEAEQGSLSALRTPSKIASVPLCYKNRIPTTCHRIKKINV